MSETTGDLRQAFGRFVASLGVAATAAAALTGLSYLAGSVYLDSFLGRFGATWALDTVSASVRISAGWWMVAAVAGYGAVRFGDAFHKLPLPEVAMAIGRRSDLIAALTYLASLAALFVLGETRLPAILTQLSAWFVIGFFVLVRVASLADLVIAGLSKPDPYTVRWLAYNVVLLLLFGFVFFPAAVGRVWAFYNERLDLRPLPLAEVHDVSGAAPWKCRVILTTEERLLCVDPALFASRKHFSSRAVQVIPWANVRIVYHGSYWSY